jgi:AcrR family transcriptional regulator
VIERILDAAGELFERHGVNGVGMAEVAAAAGCSRATLYRYVENRHALHVAFVHREARRIGASITATDVVDAVMAAIHEVRATPVLAAWFRAGDAGIAAELAGASAVIESLGAAFLGDPDDPDVVARACWLVRVIVSLLAVPGESEADERAMLERFVAPVVRRGRSGARRRSSARAS